MQCSACPIGKYANESGSTSCATCPPHSTSTHEGATCVCDAGYISDGITGCQAC
jgi:hypothetical protein